MSNAIPTVVIVGRPNVGKSTLFNRITGQRRSIVGDEPGITRDRIHGTAEHDGRRFELIDTGGIVVHDQEYIPGQILRQAEVALKDASHIIFLVDGRAEITGSDRDLSQMLMRLGKPVSLAVNKIDAQVRDGLTNEFYGSESPMSSRIGRARNRRGRPPNATETPVANDGEDPRPR
jgi:GTP-binding protein